MEALLHQFMSGLANGGIYASIALALVMIYRSTHHVNFAQGELAMASTYLAWCLLQVGLPYWVAILATILISIVTGVMIERMVIRRVQNESALTVVIAFIALMVIINSTIGWIFGYSIKTFESPFPPFRESSGHLISSHEIGMIVVNISVLLVMLGFFRFTKAGLAMRAVAQNPMSSRLSGIRVDWMLALGWGLAGGIGAVAGVMAAPVVYLDPNMMNGILLYALAGALLGGIDNPWGAAIGGFLVGVLENLAGAYLVGTELKLTVALFIIIGILLIRPAGLFGRVLVTRV